MNNNPHEWFELRGVSAKSTPTHDSDLHFAVKNPGRACVDDFVTILNVKQWQLRIK